MEVVSPEVSKEGEVLECGECLPERIGAEEDREVKKLGDPRLPTDKEREKTTREHICHFGIGVTIVSEEKVGIGTTGRRWKKREG